MSDCVEREKFKITIALGKLGKLVARGLCNVLNTTLETIKLLLQSQLAIFQPVAALENVFIDSFIIFPQSAASATIGATQDVSKRLKEFGIGKQCPELDSINKSVDNGNLERFKRWMDNNIDKAKARKNLLSGVINDLNKGIGAIDQIKPDCSKF